MIDLILHQLGIKPENIRDTMNAFTSVARSAQAVDARLARIEAHLGITGDLVLPSPEAKAIEDGTGKRDGGGSPSGGGARGRRRTGSPTL